MRKLDHPNIIKLHEVYEGSNHVYLVMDYVEGDELFQTIVKEGKQNEQFVTYYSF